MALLAASSSTRFCSSPSISTSMSCKAFPSSSCNTLRQNFSILSSTRFCSSPSISIRQSGLLSKAFLSCSGNALKQNLSTLFISKAAKVFGNRKGMVPPSQASTGEKSGKILLSDVEVKSRPRIYWGRKWDSVDIATGTVVLGMHIACVFAPFTFSWSAFWLAVLLYFVTGLFGITLSFHRNLAHRSFKLPKWLEYLFAYCGAQAMQGNPMDWVSTHRFHHQFCDSDRDPHSPFEGFWFSHMSWFFDNNTIVKKCGEANNVGDMQKQPFYRFMQKTYVYHPIALAILLYGLGGFPFLVWGVAVRTVWVYHITWFVNSACHVWGKQTWNTRDLSRNNWWVAVLAFGEGWHNNHHAFEFSARHGLEWWQLDVTWYVVKLLQAIGLATDVKVPSEVQKQRMALTGGATTI